MKNLFATMAILAASAATVDAKLIVLPPTVSSGNDIAIIWIHGMSCDNAAYQTLA
jgi:hypothetical protein